MFELIKFFIESRCIYRLKSHYSAHLSLSDSLLCFIPVFRLSRCENNGKPRAGLCIHRYQCKICASSSKLQLLFIFMERGCEAHLVLDNRKFHFAGNQTLLGLCGNMHFNAPEKVMHSQNWALVLTTWFSSIDRLWSSNRRTKATTINDIGICDCQQSSEEREKIKLKCFDYIYQWKRRTDPLFSWMRCNYGCAHVHAFSDDIVFFSSDYQLIYNIQHQVRRAAEYTRYNVFTAKRQQPLA